MDIFNQYKKFFLVGGFIIAVIIMGYCLYYFIFRPTFFPANPAPAGPTATSSQGKLPGSGPNTGGTTLSTSTQTGLVPSETIGNEKVDDIANGGKTKTTTIANVETEGMTSGTNDSIQYYNKEDGKFYRVDKDGKISALSDKVFYSVDNITWSPDKNKAILEYPDGAKIIYNFSTSQQVSIPRHWQDFSFSADGASIVTKSLGTDPSNRWLAIVSADGSQAKKVEEIGDNDKNVYPLWSPNNQIVGMYTEGVDLNRQEVYFIGQNKENFKSTTIEGRGFQPKWSPTGEKLLYSVYSSDTNFNPALWVVDAAGDNIGAGRKRLNIETWADKCSFTNSTEIYCAVPNSLPEGSGMFAADASKQTTDNLYKINIQTGAKKLIAVPDGDYNIADITVSNDGSSLFFTDGANNNVHKIKLK